MRVPEPGATPSGPAPAAAPAFPSLPPALQSMLAALPVESWPKIRIVLVETEEEGELVELLPDLKRAMMFCPPRLVTRQKAGELEVGMFDRCYARLHEALHGVREAVSTILDLGGLRARERAGQTPRGAAPPAGPPNSSRF